MNTDYRYEIRVEGNLPTYWAEWFAALSITNEKEGTAIIRGRFADQAALFGLLMRLHGLNITLISVSRCQGTAREKTRRTRW